MCKIRNDTGRDLPELLRLTENLILDINQAFNSFASTRNALVISILPDSSIYFEDKR